MSIFHGFWQGKALKVIIFNAIQNASNHDEKDLPDFRPDIKLGRK